MKLEGNTILITGGGSGIGLGLAREFKNLGNDVVVAGRSRAKLEHAASFGLATLEADVSNAEVMSDFAARVTKAHPRLNVVIHNAGVMINEKVTAGDASKIASETIATNLLGPIFLTNALLPHLMKQNAATIMTVTSGLAFVPLAMTPSYSATKAAIHSYKQSLRYQLRDTSVEVKELVPPYVRTALMGERQARDENAMPLEDFVREVVAILRDKPDADEITVERVRPQRTAGFDQARYDEFFTRQNDMLFRARKAEWDQLG